MSRSVLIIEDDLALSNGIALTLKSGDNLFEQCHSIRAAKEKLACAAFDLILLDINLPDGSGLELLRDIKKAGAAPVILLTANDTESDIVTGLESGADDYITKPFSLAVLRARVNTQLRKGAKNACFVQEPFSFDFEAMKFLKGTALIELSKTEQKLLRYLVENKGVTLLRGTLIDKIWTDSADFVDENALSVSIKRLRDKLEDNPSKPQYIKTVYGIGYTWAVSP